MSCLVRGRSKIFLAGPPLVKAAIGEDADDEELGGAQLHGEVTGLGEYVAEDDAQAIAYAREILANIRWDEAGAPVSAAAPDFDAEELMGIVPAGEKAAFDMREVIARVVDGSDFLEFKQAYSPDTLCGHASIEGTEGRDRGQQRPDHADRFAQGGAVHPALRPGRHAARLPAEHDRLHGWIGGRAGGAVKHGSKMIQAVANARVPKFTILIGGSYGAGNYGMCGRGFSPRLIFSWPSAKTAVMGGEQAAKVMEIVARGKAAREGAAVDEDALARQGAGIRAGIEAQSGALFATARLWDDGIIDPRDTRRVLGLCLAIAAEGERRVLRPNSFGVARG
jgi:geranyl-CoA carboxylase beta subunit